MRWFGRRLPRVPTGYECFDMLWSLLMPNAASYVAVLPHRVDPAWASQQGLRLVAVSLLRRWSASDELRRTPAHSALCRMRQRQLRLLERQYQGRALLLVGALVDQALKRHPKASPAQLLTMARDALKELLSTAFSIEGLSAMATEEHPLPE